MPKALPNSLKPRVPGEEDEEDAPDDEEGILRTCQTMDDLVQGEIDRGVPPERIVIGGFSQGCAVSLVWGLIGKNKDKVAGVVPVAGYFPLAGKIGKYRTERGFDEGDKGSAKWLYVHGSKDMLVPMRLFEQGKAELFKWVRKEDIEDKVYEGMGHSTDNRVLRDLLGFLSKVTPP